MSCSASGPKEILRFLSLAPCHVLQAPVHSWMKHWIQCCHLQLQEVKVPVAYLSGHGIQGIPTRGRKWELCL